MLNLNNDNFKAEVLDYAGKVLVDFWAPWCGPCKMLSPIIDEIAAEHPELKVGKVNVDDEVALAMQFKVSAIPTVVLFENGKAVSQFMGYRPKEDVMKFIG